MSYAIIRNEKLTRAECIGMHNHNDRKTKNHSNKNIDVQRTNMNYYIKQSELSYIKEFDKIKGESDLKGQIRTNSIIMCEMVITSDSEFFNKIGPAETKRYFEESYNFVCNYKNLGSKYVVSAVVHLDEDTPHMHLMYIPVIHTKDKDGNSIEKLSCRDFWKGRDSYRNLQDEYHKYITSKGFDLERGKAANETKREHLSIKEYKEITNFNNTKKVLESINIELPETPELKDIKKVVFKRDEIIEEKIIKPKDKLINKLHQDNVTLQKELSRQVNLVSKAETYQKENTKITSLYEELNLKYKKMENNFKNKITKLENVIEELKEDVEFFKNKFEKLKIGVKTFVSWVASKLSNETENSLLRKFKREKNITLDINDRKNEKSRERE